jgi:hypothetical protein
MDLFPISHVAASTLEVSREENIMCLADFTETREIITAAATAEVPSDRPAICGTVMLHCLDGGEPLRLSMPMLDAMLLLHSLRQIEEEFELEDWSARLGGMNTIEELGAELHDIYLDSTETEEKPHPLNS